MYKSCGKTTRARELKQKVNNAKSRVVQFVHMSRCPVFGETRTDGFIKTNGLETFSDV